MINAIERKLRKLIRHRQPPDNQDLLSSDPSVKVHASRKRQQHIQRTKNIADYGSNSAANDDGGGAAMKGTDGLTAR
jgi:hypothetical protein